MMPQLIKGCKALLCQTQQDLALPSLSNFMPPLALAHSTLATEITAPQKLKESCHFQALVPMLLSA